MLTFEPFDNGFWVASARAVQNDESYDLSEYGISVKYITSAAGS